MAKPLTLPAGFETLEGSGFFIRSFQSSSFRRGDLPNLHHTSCMRACEAEQSFLRRFNKMLNYFRVFAARTVDKGKKPPGEPSTASFSPLKAFGALLPANFGRSSETIKRAETTETSTFLPRASSTAWSFVAVCLLESCSEALWWHIR